MVNSDLLLILANAKPTGPIGTAVGVMSDVQSLGRLCTCAGHNHRVSGIRPKPHSLPPSRTYAANRALSPCPLGRETLESLLRPVSLVVGPLESFLPRAPGLCSLHWNRQPLVQHELWWALLLSLPLQARSSTLRSCLQSTS